MIDILFAIIVNFLFLLILGMGCKKLEERVKELSGIVERMLHREELREHQLKTEREIKAYNESLHQLKSLTEATQRNPL